MTDDSAEIPFESFLQEALVSSFSMGRDVHSLMLSIQHNLASMASATLQRALKDGFGRLSWRMTCPNHTSFPSLDSCQEMFLWVREGVNLVLHPVVGLCSK